jgi:glycosyltransferase involved in cell wall biosynthesis
MDDFPACQPIVSIGMPVYNGGHYLRQAVESLLNQSFKDFELIVSDNASQDDTQDVIKSYQRTDPRVRYYRYPRNVGAIRNFNRLVELASGDYFMWAAHDDFWEPAYIERCLEVLERDSPVVLCYTATNFVDESGRHLEAFKDPFRVDQQLATERYMSLIAHLDWCNCFYGLIRTSVLTATKLYQANNGAGDCILLAELSLMGKFAQLDEPLFNRRKPTRPADIELRLSRMQQRQTPHIPQKALTPLPYTDMLRGHLDVVKDSSLTEEEKNELIKGTVNVLMTRYGNLMRYEVARTIKLIAMGIFRSYWGNTHLQSEKRYPVLDQSFLVDLLAKLDFAMWLMPGQPGLNFGRAIVLMGLGRKKEACLALNTELAIHPSFDPAKQLLEELEADVPSVTRRQQP